MKSRFWEWRATEPQRPWYPDPQEIAEMQAAEEEQEKCKHPNFNIEDGCPDCGYYAK